MVRCISDRQNLAGGGLREREGRQGRERKWIQWAASVAHNIYFGLVLKASQKPQCKSVWNETRTGFHQIGNYSNLRMDSCFTKQLGVSKLHPTEAAFLCWMSNGIWSILYPKIWQITERWIQKILLVSSWNSDKDLRKFWQTPGLLLYEVFHFCRSGIWPTIILRPVKTHQSVIPGRPGWSELLHSCLHPVTVLLFHSCRDICFKQAQLIQRRQQQCKNIQQKRCWQGFTIVTFFPQNTRWTHSIKEDCWTKSLPDHKYKKNKGWIPYEHKLLPLIIFFPKTK